MACSACSASCGDSGAVAERMRSTGGSAMPESSSVFRWNGVVTSARGRGTEASVCATSAGKKGRPLSNAAPPSMASSADDSSP
jgi:hypothetical protein